MATTRLTPEQKAERKAARQRADAAAIEGGVPTAVEKMAQQSFTHPDKVRAEGLVTKARETVIVACKVGVAYIDLRLFQPQQVWEQTQTGPRQVTEYRATGKLVRIRGTQYPRGTVPDGFPDRPEIVNGAALTRNVDKAFWKAYLEQNQHNPLVTNGLIFAHDDIASIRSQARELEGQLSGLEPIDTKGDARVPKPVNAALTPIQPADRGGRGNQESVIRTVSETIDVDV